MIHIADRISPDVSLSVYNHQERTITIPNGTVTSYTGGPIAILRYDLFVPAELLLNTWVVRLRSCDTNLSSPQPSLILLFIFTLGKFRNQDQGEQRIEGATNDKSTRINRYQRKCWKWISAVDHAKRIGRSADTASVGCAARNDFSWMLSDTTGSARSGGERDRFVHHR